MRTLREEAVAPMALFTKGKGVEMLGDGASMKDIMAEVLKGKAGVEKDVIGTLMAIAGAA